MALNYIITGPGADLNSGQNGQDAILPMISVSLPIWRKQYKAAVKEAETRSLQYQNQHDEALLQVQNEWDKAQFDWREGQREYQLFAREIQLAENTLELALTDYANGREDFEEILRL